jgi:hypothetical protein
MHRFMATSAPAGPACQQAGVVKPANDNPAGGSLVLDVTLHAEGVISVDQHLVVH